MNEDTARFIEQEQGKHFCQCGCGGSIKIMEHHYKIYGIPRFIRGHGSRVANGRRGFVGASTAHKIEFSTWRRMISRCYWKKNDSYKNYGGRGIKVCERWRNSFQNFYDDMGPRPPGKMTLDRINNDGNYEPANCRWATWKQQQNNSRWNRKLTHQGKTMSCAAWGDELGLSARLIWKRLKKGWPVEKVLSPVVRPSTQKIEVNGQRRTISEWSKFSGVGPKTIKRRLAKGWKAQDAVLTKKPTKKYTFNGETKTLSEWASFTGIKRITLYARIKNGWKLGDALSVPAAYGRANARYNKKT